MCAAETLKHKSATVSATKKVAETLGARIRMVRSRRQESQEKFGRALGSTRQTIDRYEKGQRTPDAEFIEVLSALEPDLSMDWLMRGIGPMFEQVNPDIAKRIRSNLIEVPFYKDLKPAAGGGAVIEGEAAELVAFDRAWLQRFFDIDPRNIIMFAARGESMEPMIHAGDPLLIDTGTSGKALDEGIFVIRHESALLVKRLQPLPGHRLRVSSTNEAYGPFELRLDDESLDFAIIGRVICVCRRM